MQPAAAIGKVVSRTQPTRNSLTQVSLAQLLGVNESSSSSSNVTLTLNMTSSPVERVVVEEAEATATVELAKIERARTQKRKAPEGPRGRSKIGRMTVEPKSVPKLNRLTEFPEQGLKISAGALFCQPCKMTLPNIRGSIVHHLATKKHEGKLQVFLKQQQEDNNLRTELSDYFTANPDERQESLVDHLAMAFT